MIPSSIWKRFVSQSREEGPATLRRFINQGKMTKSAYLQMKAQQGKPVKPEEIPLEFEDLPYDAQISMFIYNKLGNRVYGDVGYIGKDFTILPMLVEYHEIVDTDLLLDYLNVLEDYNIDKSQKAIKEITDKVGKK